MYHYKQPRERNDKVTAEDSAHLDKLINDMPVLPPVVVSVPTSYKYHQGLMDVNAVPNNTFSKQLIQLVSQLAVHAQNGDRRMHKIEKNTRRIERILLSQNPKGEVYPINLTITGLVHIDFVDSNYTSPSVRNAVTTPQTELYELIITNTGSSDLKYKTNVSANDTNADATVVAAKERDLKFPVPTIRTLNLVCASGTSTTVTLTCII